MKMTLFDLYRIVDFDREIYVQPKDFWIEHLMRDELRRARSLEFFEWKRKVRKMKRGWRPIVPVKRPW